MSQSDPRRSRQSNIFGAASRAESRQPVLKKKFEAARKSLVLRADPVIVVMKGLGGSSHGSKNILCGGWSDFCAGGATPSLADLHGLASRDRYLDGTDVGELDWPRRRKGFELLRAESRYAQLAVHLTSRHGRFWS